MTKSAWAHLPNAVHIDRVLAHAKAHPEKWGAAWDAVRVAAWGAAREAAWDAVRVAARDAARAADWDAAWDAAQEAALVAARDAVGSAAWGAMRALIVWDEAGDLLSQPPAMVKFLKDEGVYAAVLLYPAVLAMQEVSHD